MILAPFMLSGSIKKSVCNALVKYYENSLNKVPGSLRDTATDSLYVDLEYKDSLDLNIPCHTQDKEVVNYFNELTGVLDAYKKAYVWCDKNQGRWTITENFNIQRYRPGQAFKAWHFERSAAALKRHLVFMTYLNDVNDGGETEWFYQEVKIKPQKGLTVIWPADWTFTHRGIPSATETKYIATGWYSFV